MRFPALALAVFSIFASAASSQADEVLRIDLPAANTTVSGIVEIRGAAAAPGMMRFRVEFGYDPDPTKTWFLIFEGTEPVPDGQLALWDTTSIREGEYALRLAAFFADGSMQEMITRGVRVRRDDPPAATSSPEAVTAIASEPGAYARAAAGFPAPTAVFDAKPALSMGTAPLQKIAFLGGAALTVAGFGLFWVRTRWLWWKRRLFIRKVRKRGK
ncbi:MAG: hypothetical protein JW748_15250 [Anaerolineales bacterium]|nr:hypothetical protein [Anaerolineales bacterium]